MILFTLKEERGWQFSITAPDHTVVSQFDGAYQQLGFGVECRIVFFRVDDRKSGVVT